MTNTIITIGREFGSGGCEIGHKLAEKLGIKCYDKDMLDLAAKESGICQEIFESHDEKQKNSDNVEDADLEINEGVEALKVEMEGGQ